MKSGGITLGRSDASVARPTEHHELRTRLIVSDLLALVLGFTIMLWGLGCLDRFGPARFSMLVAFAAAVGLWSIRSQGLLHARISAVRTVEISRLAKAVALNAGLVV